MFPVFRFFGRIFGLDMIVKELVFQFKVLMRKKFNFDLKVKDVKDLYGSKPWIALSSDLLLRMFDLIADANLSLSCSCF